MCIFFKAGFIAVASASQAGKPERLTLWALLLYRKTVLDSIVLHSKLPETVAFLFFALQEETGCSTEMDYCDFFNV